MNKVECFKIQILKSDNPFDVTRGEILKQINCEPHVFLREPKTILADPFLLVYNNILFLFFEDKSLYHPGVISMVYTMDLKNWSKPKVVLEEPYHLSYPWVFKDNGHVYMIPETSSDHSIRLYEAVSNKLDKFKYCTTIIKNTDYNIYIDYSDTSIYKKEGIYYLMTTVNKSGVNKLELYVSDRLTGPYLLHPVSPVAVGNKYGRNAGSLLDYNGKLYRVAQDCEYRYGDDVHLLEVDIINKQEYKEHVVNCNLLANKTGFYSQGGHQVNFVKFKDSFIVSTDAKEYHYFLVQKLIHKIGFYSKG